MSVRQLALCWVLLVKPTDYDELMMMMVEMMSGTCWT